MDDTIDFEIGDHVVYLLDGDIGMVADIDYSRGQDKRRDEPYYIEWYISPAQSGWHSAFHSEHDERVMVLLGGPRESR